MRPFKRQRPQKKSGAWLKRKMLLEILAYLAAATALTGDTINNILDTIKNIIDFVKSF